MKKLKWIFYPSYWLMNYKYEKMWDDKLLALINNYRFIEIDVYSASIGGVNVWTANQPYCTMHPSNMRVRASRYVTMLAVEKYNKECLEELKEAKLKKFNATLRLNQNNNRIIK